VFIAFVSKNVGNVVGLGDSEDVQSMSKGMKDEDGNNAEKDKNDGEDGGNDMDVGGEGHGKPQGPR